MNKILGQRVFSFCPTQLIHRCLHPPPRAVTLPPTTYVGLSRSAKITSTGSRHYCTNTPATNETSESQTLAKNPGPVPHYTLKIGSFSSLVEMLKKFNENSYESETFEACGYKWKMLLYPNGDEETKGTDYISVFLKIQETSSLPPGWLIKSAVCKVFVLDQIGNNYITLEPFSDVRLYEKCIGMGFPRLLSLGLLKDGRYGFLKDDKCIIGAEIIFDSFVSTREYLPPFESEGEYLSPFDKLSNTAFTWNLVDQYISHDKLYSSQEFDGGNCKWRLILYRSGRSQDGYASLSAFLTLLADSETPPRVYAEYNLSIKNEKTGDHKEFKDIRHLFYNRNQSHGTRDVALKIEDDNGETLKDPLTVQVEITRVATMQISNFNWSSYSHGGVSIDESLETKWGPEVDGYGIKEQSFDPLCFGSFEEIGTVKIIKKEEIGTEDSF